MNRHLQHVKKCFSVLLLISLAPASARAFNDCDGLELFPAAYGGYNHLIKYYDGYSNMQTAGGDLFVTIARKWRSGTSSDCNDQVMFRLTGQYSPMKVPTGNNALSEELAGLSIAALYRFGSPVMKEVEYFSPYLGVGGGMVWDMTTVDTPASGKISSASHAADLSVIVGAFGPALFSLIRPSAEVRVHGTFVPNGLAYNAEYLLGLVLAPGSPARERRKVQDQGDAGPVNDKRKIRAGPKSVF